MSDLQLQNLSNSETANSLTKEETSLIMGGHSCAGFDFWKSALGEINLDDPSAVKDFLSKSNFKDWKSGKADNAEMGNVINGTPGDDVLIGN